MRFSQSNHMLMYWYLEIQTFIIRTGELILMEDLCFNFSISNGPTQINFPSRIHNCYFHSHTLLYYFFILNLVFALEYLAHYWEILITFFSQFLLDFIEFSQLDILRWSPCFKLGAFATAAKFSVLLKVGIDVNIRSYLFHLHSFELLVILP